MIRRRSVVIPDGLWEELQKEAKIRNISVAAYIRLILSNRS